jgi:hypothetical protein
MDRISNYNMQWMLIKMEEVGELPAPDNFHSRKLDHFGREKEKANLSRTPNQGIRLVYTLGTTTRSDVLQGIAETCEFPIDKLFSLLRLAQYCRTLRPRWCQSGVNRCQDFPRRRSICSFRAPLLLFPVPLASDVPQESQEPAQRRSWLYKFFLGSE